MNTLGVVIEIKPALGDHEFNVKKVGAIPFGCNTPGSGVTYREKFTIESAAQIKWLIDEEKMLYAFTLHTNT